MSAFGEILTSKSLADITELASEEYTNYREALMNIKTKVQLKLQEYSHSITVDWTNKKIENINDKKIHSKIMDVFEIPTEEDLTDDDKNEKIKNYVTSVKYFLDDYENREIKYYILESFGLYISLFPQDQLRGQDLPNFENNMVIFVTSLLLKQHPEYPLTTIDDEELVRQIEGIITNRFNHDENNNDDDDDGDENGDEDNNDRNGRRSRSRSRDRSPEQSTENRSTRFVNRSSNTHRLDSHRGSQRGGKTKKTSKKNRKSKRTSKK